MANLLQVGMMAKGRDEWRFTYTTAELLDAATIKATYHRGRQNYWALEKAKTEDRLKEKGIEIQEFDVTGGKRTEAKLNAALSNRLTECHNKWSQHRDIAEEFEVWIAVLRHDDPKFNRLLGPADVNYFSIGLTLTD